MKTAYREFNWILSNLPVIIALIMICCAPFLLLQNEQEIANQIAGYAYYLLVVGILWKIIQFVLKLYPHKDNISTKQSETKA